MPRAPRLLIPLALSLTLVLAGCGQDETDASSADGSASPSPSESAAAFPVTVDTPTGEVTIEEEPERIVSLSPSATEILFAIGAGDQVEAADSFSTYPEEAPTTDLSGFEPNVEAVAGYQPDLVVIANDANDLVASMEELDIPVLLNPAPATIEEGYDGMAALGLATGHPDETAALVSDLRSQIDDALAQAPDEAVRVYHELDDTYYSASSSSFIGDVYAQMGAENIADAADKSGSGYPQLTEEAIIEADPQLIVITDQVGYTAEDVANRPGWGDITAVENGDIVTVDADVASRWGPRLPQLVSAVAEAMTSAAAGVPAG